MNRQVVSVDFGKICGVIKPMHGVNNGPSGSAVRGTGNAADYSAAGIPYARTHDSSFYTNYGGEFTVDVHRIFRNFDADENDPASYLFTPTDQYLRSIIEAGTKVFYRLGASIEHRYKYGTYPPKDFHKWARVCEHIIRHYTEGWADGFNYDIEYWELWNEPDNYNADGTNPCWQGSSEEFIEFFCLALSHLKDRFPHLKIGGPAFVHAKSDMAPLLGELNKRKLTLDFLSYHGYETDPHVYPEKAARVRKLLDSYGFTDTELHLNEWNYVKGWVGEDWKYSLKMEKGLKGSSFITATMCLMQYSKADMLMYYDARPCGMNGMFNTDTLEPLKGYYPFKAFGELYRLKGGVPVKSDDKELCALAATNGKRHAVLLTYYSDNDGSGPKEVQIDLTHIDMQTPKKIELYLLDATHNLTCVRCETVQSDTASLFLTLNLFDTYLMRITEA